MSDAASPDGEHIREMAGNLRERAAIVGFVGDCAACHHVALLTPGALLKLGLSHHKGARPQRAGPVSRVRSEGDGPSYRSSGRARAREPPPRQPARNSAGLGVLDYGNAAEAKEAMAPQIAAQSSSDRSNVAIKDAPLPGDHREQVSRAAGRPTCDRLKLRNKCPATGFCGPQLLRHPVRGNPDNGVAMPVRHALRVKKVSLGGF
jgi:hypothetical protein